MLTYILLSFNVLKKRLYSRNVLFKSRKLCCDFKVYNLKPKLEYKKKVYAQLNLVYLRLRYYLYITNVTLIYTNTS
jgi:hypothetical protein